MCHCGWVYMVYVFKVFDMVVKELIEGFMLYSGNWCVLY